MSNRKDIFRQKQCAACKGFFYEDELQDGDSGGIFCRHCYINTIRTKRSFISRVNIEIGKGLHLFELLMSIAIIGVMAGIVIPNIMKIRENTANKTLLNIYTENQGTQVGDMAEQFLAAYEQGTPLQDAVTGIPQLNVDDISTEEFQALEKKLGNAAGIGVEELKLGKAMQAIMDLQWYRQQIELLEETSFLT